MNRKSRKQEAYRLNRRLLYPYFAKELQQTYEERVENTIAHYIRAFRYPIDKKSGKTSLNFSDKSILRIRLSYLYWVSIHTGLPDRNFTALFTGFYDEYGEYSLIKSGGEDR